jgi:hypothetical protein
VNEWVWDMGGMVLTGENRSIGRKIYPSATLSTTKVKCTALVSNSGLCDRVPTTNSSQLRHGLHATCPTHVVTDQTKIPTPGSVIFINPVALRMLPRMFLFVRKQRRDHTNVATPDRCHYSLVMSGGRWERGKWSSPSSHDAISPPAPHAPSAQPLISSRGLPARHSVAGRTNGRVGPHRTASDRATCGPSADGHGWRCCCWPLWRRRTVSDTACWLTLSIPAVTLDYRVSYRFFWHQGCPQHPHWSNVHVTVP